MRAIIVILLMAIPCQVWAQATSVPCNQMPAMTGDATTSAGACAVNVGKINGTTAGAAATLGLGAGLASSVGNIVSNAKSYLTFQPGLITAIVNTKAVFYKISKASTVGNIAASAITFTCAGNPTITMYECGASATCAGPTTIGSATVTASGTAVDGTISNGAIAAGDYVAFAISAGTCTALDIQASAELSQN